MARLAASKLHTGSCQAGRGTRSEFALIQELGIFRAGRFSPPADKKSRVGTPRPACFQMPLAAIRRLDGMIQDACSCRLCTSLRAGCLHSPRTCGISFHSGQLSAFRHHLHENVGRGCCGCCGCCVSCCRCTERSFPGLVPCWLGSDFQGWFPWLRLSKELPEQRRLLYAYCLLVRFRPREATCQEVPPNAQPKYRKSSPDWQTGINRKLLLLSQELADCIRFF